MSAICTNYFDIFDNHFLIESRKNWPWKDASIDKYEPTYKQLNSIKQKDSLKIVKRYYKIHLTSYKPYFVHKSRIKISLKSTHTFHTLKNCLTTYDGHRSFYNAIQILLYFCWSHKLIYFRKNDNSLLPIVKIYMELSPDEQVMWLPGLNWARKLYSLIAWQGIFLFQSTCFSVLGGAYSALGRYKKEHAEKAKHLARNQIVLAKKLQDPVLECKCWIYYAEGLIQLGKLKKAALIIERQKNMVMDMLKSDDTLLSMCENAKLKLMVKSRK